MATVNKIRKNQILKRSIKDMLKKKETIMVANYVREIIEKANQN